MSQADEFKFAFHQLGCLHETIEEALPRTCQYSSLGDVIGTPDEALFKLALEQAAVYSDRPARAKLLLAQWFSDEHSNVS
jgi:hypothetical protein